MDFNDTKEEAAFRAEAAAWLKDNVPSQDELAGLRRYCRRQALAEA